MFFSSSRFLFHECQTFAFHFLPIYTLDLNCHFCSFCFVMKGRFVQSQRLLSLFSDKSAPPQFVMFWKVFFGCCCCCRSLSLRSGNWSVMCKRNFVFCKFGAFPKMERPNAAQWQTYRLLYCEMRNGRNGAAKDCQSMQTVQIYSSLKMGPNVLVHTNRHSRKSSL